MSFEELYNLFKDRIFNLALQYTQDYQEAEEITQDVFLAVYQSQDRFRGEAQLSTWIHRIAVNKCLDWLKGKRRKKRRAFLTGLFSADGTLHHDAGDFNHPGARLEHKEELARVFRILNGLPDNQKTAFILSRLEHHSGAEIAEIMGLSPKAVESLIQRAKTNLIKKLQSGGK